MTHQRSKLGDRRAGLARRHTVALGLHQSFHWRLIFITIFFLAILAAIAVRVFSLAIVEHRFFVLAAERQHKLFQVLSSLRGTIFAQDKAGALLPLASQKSFYTLIASPKEISDPAGAVSALMSVAPMDRASLTAKLEKSGDPYEVLARKLEAGIADKIRALSISGLTLVEERRRIYPQGNLAASLVGFASYNEGEERGEYGLEKQYQERLEGSRGFFEGERDYTSGYWVALGRRILNPPVDGDNLVLTVDLNVQFKVEAELAALLKKWQGTSALAIAMEPKTGRILALASQPSFDPNNYPKEKDFSVFRMAAVDSQFELGSVFKPITMSGSINEGALTASTTYSDPGTRRFSGRTISNFDGKSHGLQTMTQVLEKSLNTGAIFAMEKLGHERFLDVVKRFGFGAKTGIDFPGEISGDISNLAGGGDIDFATASFGQGIAITPIQIAAAISAIANHGVLMRPYLVEKFIDSGGNEEVIRPREGRRVISIETAETASKMLVSVVRNGFDNRAGVKGYFVAGKTGTAQIPLANGRGYSDEVIHTFVGYAPAFDPKFVLLLQINKPKGNLFAANTLSPSFQNLAEFILNYYQVPPDEK